ncbi:hypothetical protein CsSME_00011851 [Camellia sinensis var. sinensis]
MYFLQEKESLITELRKELRLSNEEHRELLGRVNADDVIRRIRSDSVMNISGPICLIFFSRFGLFYLLIGSIWIMPLGSGDRLVGFNLACLVLVKLFMIQCLVPLSQHHGKNKR